MVSTNTTQTSFKIRLDLYDKLRLQAVKERRTQAEIMNQAIEEYIQRNSDQTKLVEWMITIKKW